MLLLLLVMLVLASSTGTQSGDTVVIQTSWSAAAATRVDRRDGKSRLRPGEGLVVRHLAGTSVVEVAARRMSHATRCGRPTVS